MAKMKSKKLKSHKKSMTGTKRKWIQMEEERTSDRSWDGKQLLVKFKKLNWR